MCIGLCDCCQADNGKQKIHIAFYVLFLDMNDVNINYTVGRVANDFASSSSVGI